MLPSTSPKTRRHMHSHSLTLDGRPLSRLATLQRTRLDLACPRALSAISRLSALGRSARLLSLCLHALSSFQRTGYSDRAGAPTDRALPSVLGEPSEVTIQNLLCQARCVQRRFREWLSREELPSGAHLSDVAHGLGTRQANFGILRRSDVLVNTHQKVVFFPLRITKYRACIASSGNTRDRSSMTR